MIESAHEESESASSKDNAHKRLSYRFQERKLHECINFKKSTHLSVHDNTPAIKQLSHHWLFSLWQQKKGRSNSLTSQNESDTVT